MRKLGRQVILCAMITGAIWCMGVMRDRKVLNEELIRLHVIANSDSQMDQEIKLAVRDAVMASLSKGMEEVADIHQARVYIQTHLPQIQRITEDTLEKLGCSREAMVSLQEAVFDTRVYDSFTLPAGVYETLRITIGDGEGKNWWCVVYPGLCVPAAGEGFRDVAAGAGFPDGLTSALQGDSGYEIRFYLLDLLGKLEGILRKG